MLWPPNTATSAPSNEAITTVKGGLSVVANRLAAASISSATEALAAEHWFANSRVTCIKGLFAYIA
jgi:hypothetical protein